MSRSESSELSEAAKAAPPRTRSSRAGSGLDEGEAGGKAVRRRAGRGSATRAAGDRGDDRRSREATATAAADPASGRLAPPEERTALARTGESRSLTRVRPRTEIVDRRGKGIVLVVDDDAERAGKTADALHASGYHYYIAHRSEAAFETLDRHRIDVVLVERRLEGAGGEDVVGRFRDLYPHVPLIVVGTHSTIHGAVKSAVEATRLGATAYLVRPVAVEELLEAVETAVASGRLLRSGREDRRPVVHDVPQGFENIIYNSEKMHDIVTRCAQVAATDATVLLSGESGTGKDLLARAIHRASPRRNQRFVPVHCAALSSNIIESELFGHEKGAFTGAVQARKGYFEHSDKGTIFLDEVGDIPPETQVKLLRVLENREIVRVGSNEPITVDVRVISATHRDLEERVREGQFRDDLYYRLKVVTIQIPPLRERPQDIPPLIAYFFRQYSETYGKHFDRIEPEALAALVSHEWKGNVRELKHAIENLIVVAPGPAITLADLPDAIRRSRRLPPGQAAGLESLVGVTIQEVERELIRHTLEHVNGNRQEAARMLGIAERTLYRRLKEYGLG